MVKKTGDETISGALAPYELGPKLRKLRLRKKIGLKDLARHTGLSASLLSQLENGRLVPTLPTLVRIAMVFDVNLEHFFCDAKRQRAFLKVRAGERLRFPERPDLPSPAYFFECLAYPAQGKGFQAYHAEFPRPPGEGGQDHFHEGFEFLHVIEGTLCVRYQGQDEMLNAGDSAYFNSGEPHSYRGLTEPSARAVVVTLPPRI
jgi:transcriptional regulator with XRE-family HTH domain